MRDSPSPKLRLSDAMILVAATALAIAWARTDLDEENMAPWRFDIGSGSFQEVTHSLWTWIARLLPLGTTWAFALLAIRLRRPRPRFRALVQQPGLAACLTVILVMGFNFCGLLGEIAGRFGPHAMLTGPGPDFSFWSTQWQEWKTWAERTGTAVLSVRIILTLSGGCRPESSWIDRTARALGIFWIGAVPFAWFANMSS